MKTAVYFKHFLSAFAALVLLCVASSCKDQNFDWDNVHSLSYTQKFTDTFIKEFGQPAPGHQWGFDFNWENAGATRAVVRPDGTMIVVKPDTDEDGKQIIYEWGGSVPDITDRESKEVYEWFRTHQVTWTNTVKEIGDWSVCFKPGYEGDPYVFDVHTLKWDGKVDQDFKISTADYTKIDDFKNILSNKKLYGKITIGADTYEGIFTVNDTGLITWRLSNYEFDGIHTTRDTGLTAMCTYTITDTDYSLDNTENMGPSYNQKGVAIPVGTRVNFTNAWIQHVASERFSSDSWDVSTTLKNSDSDHFGADEISFSNESLNPAGKMDYLELYKIDGTQGHTFDWNGAKGYGYGSTTEKGYLQDGSVNKQNGVLAIGTNLNNLSYHCSLDSKKHDKWILVYLKGADYEGWYLGFDLEGYGDVTSSQATANGYCNDWIVKLTEVSLEDKWENYRLMCEDLGGDANEVTIGNTVHISDIDYNDIVLDVDRNPDKTVVKLDLRAAGGTIPLTVWYGNTILFETHEMFKSNKTFLDGSHFMTASDYAVMYNTHGGDEANTTDGIIPITLTLKFNTGATSVTKDGNNINIPSPRFDESSLQFKVWRFETQSYIDAGNNTYSPAEWVSIYNMEGDAPLKLCVPTTVQWLKERKSIKEGYPGFVNWVKDPYDYFWGASKTINQDKLCPNVVTPASGN